MEATAEAITQRMRQVQPTGPYNIFGYSFGGSLAVEVARQLDACGQALGSVILLDAYAPGTLKSPNLLRISGTHLRTIGSMNSDQIFPPF